MSHYEAGHVEISLLLPRHVIATCRNISSRKRSLPTLYVSRVSMIETMANNMVADFCLLCAFAPDRCGCLRVGR